MVSTCAPTELHERLYFQGALLERIQHGLVATDLHWQISYWNRYAEVLFQWTAKEVEGQNLLKCLVLPEQERVAGTDLAGELRDRQEWEGELPNKKKDGTTFLSWTTLSVLRDLSGEPAGYIATIADLSVQKAAEQTILEKNTALKELLTQVEQEKREVEQRIHDNIDRVLSPLLAKIEVQATPAVREYLKLARHSIEDVACPFGTKVANDWCKLTTKEVEIANMIRSGLTNKEMAHLLGVSSRTLESHRNRIRKKLGLTKEGINLTTYLRNM